MVYNLIDSNVDMKSYSNIEMLDHNMLEMLNSCADGNEELIDDIFDSFSPEAEELLESIKESVKKDDMELLRKSSHALAGICGSVGASRLQQIATDIENAVKTGNNQTALEITAELYPNYTLLKKEIAKYQESK